MKIFIKTLKMFFVMILTLILMYSGYTLFCKTILHQPFPLIFGRNFSVIITESMKPVINVGDIIIVEKQNDYIVGDIIVFNGEVGTTAHRIKSIKGNSFETMGDNNPKADDELVKKDDVYGKVVKIVPKLGFLVLFLKSPPGMIFMLLMFFYIMFLPSMLENILLPGENKYKILISEISNNLKINYNCKLNKKENEKE